MVMQVLVLAVQNAVPYEELGVATSGVTLFRFVGGSPGTAVLGAIFTHRLGLALAQRPVPGVAGGPAALPRMTPAPLGRLPPAAHDLFVAAFSSSLGTVFLVAAGVTALAFAL